ncbi:PSPB protein, partial [Oxylabes madagascariensis]|nr:PSPB protein [Oxylabes madagascariensis]
PPGRVLTVATGLGAPGGGCGMPPSAWCQDWVTALRCGALGRCPHLTQGRLDVDICAVCQQLFDFLHQASNRSAMEGVLDQVVGILCPRPPAVMTPCQALVRVLVDHLLRQTLWHIQPLLLGGTGGTQQGASPAPAVASPAPAAVSPLPQGSGGARLSPEALLLPQPLCWLCHSLVARAE